MHNGDDIGVISSFEVALEAAKGSRTLSELAQRSANGSGNYWKPDQACSTGAQHARNAPKKREKLNFTQRWAGSSWNLNGLKKLPEAIEAKRMLIEPRHPDLSIRRQCELLGLNRATYYTPAAPGRRILHTMLKCWRSKRARPWIGRTSD